MAFVEEAVTKRYVRVDTGMSAAATIPVLGKLQRVNTTSFRTRIESDIQARIKRESVGGHHTPSGNYISAADGGFRDFSRGVAQGQKGNRVSYGTVGRINFTFEYDIQPYQWKMREEDWSALTAGELAFFTHFDNHIDSIISEEELIEALTPTFT